MITPSNVWVPPVPPTMPNNGSIFLALLIALGLTVAIEGALVLLFKQQRRRLFVVMLIVNLITNPLMNIILFFHPTILPLNIILALFAQLIVIVIEAIVIKKFTDYSWGKAFALSTLFNLTSFIVGVVVFFP